jgi:lysine 2,3-aminomutase
VLLRDEQRTLIRNFEGRSFEYPEPAMVRLP